MVTINIFLGIKAIIAMFITMIIFLVIGAMPLSLTITELYSASNTSGVENQTMPIYIGINTVFTTLGGIMGIGIIVLLIAVAFGGRDDYEGPYKPY